MAPRARNKPAGSGGARRPGRGQGHRKAVRTAIVAGVNAHRAGRLAEAMRHYRQALDIDPGSPEALHGLGVIATQTGDTALAIRLLERARDADPRQPLIHDNLGNALKAAGRMADAVASYRRHLAGQPDDALALSNLGSALLATGAVDEAVATLRRAVDTRPDLAGLHNNLGSAVHAAGDLEAAISHYRAAIERDPELADGHRNLGKALRDKGDLGAAARAFMHAADLYRGPAARPGPAPTFALASRAKLRHDAAQLTYLLEAGILDPSWRVDRDALKHCAGRIADTVADSQPVPIPPDFRPRLARAYNRLVHREPAPRQPGPVINPALDPAAISADYDRNRPGITWFDDFLTADALAALRRFCLRSTVWHSFTYAGGYVGAAMEDGFLPPLLVQIAEDLPKCLPAIFGRHKPTKIWAFSYDSRLTGIDIHADYAAVNVNFWITPDSANEDPAAGGLVLWDKEAPPDWDFRTFNADTAAMQRFLEQSGATSRRIPHRQNRVVIFNSDLFHKTDDIHFKDGFENRRINVTMLYGMRDGG